MGRPARLVPGQSMPDAVLWKWEPALPYVDPDLLGSSIFLYGSESEATEGANWGGSGVLVGVSAQANPSRVHIYAVTNDHVVDVCPVARLVKHNGDPYVLPGAASDWESHPDGDDIAIRPLGAVAKSEYRYVENGLLLTEADISPDEVGPGDDCLMVGRYINQDHRQFDRPIVRFGNVAMLPELVNQDQRSFKQESFLVDMRSHAGFSGSPVFVYYEEPGWRSAPPLAEVKKTLNPLKDANAKIKALEDRVAGRHVSGIMSKVWLLGIEWGHLPIWDDVFDGARKIGRMRISSGMAGVVPAWKLADLLNKEETRMARDKAEKELSKVDEGAAVLDTSRPDEFRDFEALAKKLVRVPKRELDEKRKDES
jgi:hypothetical protein